MSLVLCCIDYSVFLFLENFEVLCRIRILNYILEIDQTIIDVGCYVNVKLGYVNLE